ncbi:MAG: hypothetical protein PHT07_10130 [Paludibacter sp.]|nr:hypothetical protein [Paludibacter sp.]
MTIVVGWIKKNKSILYDDVFDKYMDQQEKEKTPVKEKTVLGGTLIADAMLSHKSGGFYSSMHRDLEKLISLPLIFKVPNCSLGTIRYMSDFRCYDIALSVAGSHILSSIIVNKVRELCATDFVVSRNSDKIVRTSHEDAARVHQYASDFAYSDYPILEIDDVATHIKQIIHEETSYYCMEHLSESDFTKKSCQISMFGVCYKKRTLCMYEFIPKFNNATGELYIDLIKHDDEHIFIHGSANTSIRDEIIELYNSIDGETYTEDMLRKHITANIGADTEMQQNVKIIKRDKL